MDHPRLRGEHPHAAPATPTRHGSPPPARGARKKRPVDGASPRITPACAGSTAQGRRYSSEDTDHPRLRGEHGDVTGPSEGGPGSPPPARGALPPFRAPLAGRRITPACAGSTVTADTWTLSPPDHPRLRGEHSRVWHCGTNPPGSPPPARGAPAAGEPLRKGHRITPACAGSTPWWAAASAWRPDHPRLRGEHAKPCSGGIETRGSPPPARGAPRPGPADTPARRITPACAGST